MHILNFFLFVFKLTSPKVFNIRLRIPTPDAEAKIKVSDSREEASKIYKCEFLTPLADKSLVDLLHVFSAWEFSSNHFLLASLNDESPKMRPTLDCKSLLYLKQILSFKGPTRKSCLSELILRLEERQKFK